MFEVLISGQFMQTFSFSMLLLADAAFLAVGLQNSLACGEFETELFGGLSDGACFGLDQLNEGSAGFISDCLIFHRGIKSLNIYLYFVLQQMNPNRMQGIYIEVKGSHPILQELDMPIPLDGQVLIKVLSAPINPSDILFINGVIDKKDYPCIPGFEGIGLVEKSGGGVVGWRLEGKHVAFMTDHKYGSYGQFAIAEAKYCMVVESFDHSISFINPLSVVCMYELCDKYKCVVSVGAGGQLGRMMSRYFQQRGLNVINIVRNEHQASILRDEGAKIILQTEQEDFYEKYDKLAHTYQAQVLFDGIGGDISSKLIELLPHNSTVFCYSGTSLDVDPQQLMFQNKTIRGFNIYYELANRNYLELSLLYSLVQKNQRTLRTLPIKLVKEFTMEKKAERCIYIPSQ